MENNRNIMIGYFKNDLREWGRSGQRKIHTVVEFFRLVFQFRDI